MGNTIRKLKMIQKLKLIENYCLKMIFENDLKWFKMIWNDSKMIPNYSKWFKLVQHDSNWFKTIHIGSTWFKLIQHDSKYFKRFEGFKRIRKDSNWFNKIQIDSTWFKNWKDSQFSTILGTNYLGCRTSLPPFLYSKSPLVFSRWSEDKDGSFELYL